MMIMSTFATTTHSATTRRRRTPRRVRERQRFAHLLAGAVLLAYVYAAPLLGPGFASAVRWVVVPVLVISGIALWQWHRVRAAVRRRQRP
ncbi:hypothetical protein [Janibacter alittae]|uniref:Uncharacterized protein n=1 Tax=Janibacter alittae TaxID=3115209 RepID=A0ABZ2MJ94_9MICO